MKSARMEAFSDGVIAVIITIMVLELHVPHDAGWRGLLTVAPTVGIYVLSFLLTGIYWINHHELIRRVEQINYHVLWTNLLFLLSLSLVPFTTDYAGQKHFDLTSALLYNAIMFLAGATFMLLRHTVMQLQQQRGELVQQHRAEANKHVASLGVYVLAMGAVWIHPLVSFAIVLMVTLMWIVPELGTQRHHAIRHADAHGADGTR